jgi:hypothetical protein
MLYCVHVFMCMACICNTQGLTNDKGNGSIIRKVVFEGFDVTPLPTAQRYQS